MSAAITARPPPTRWVRATTGAVAALLLLPGCQGLGGATPVTDRADLVTELATQLDRSSALTYSARYQLSGGAPATIAQAQQPLRSAYLFPGGRVTVTGDATTECRIAGRTATCTLTPPPSPATRPPATVFTGAGRTGMIPPSAVHRLLTATSLDVDAVVEPHDTTIAGRHATCVTVRNLDDAAASTFTACITTEGVLGSFTGIVDGATRDIAMIRYDERVDPALFDPPPGATVVDRRPNG